MTATSYDLAVVGGGIVGAATAFKLQQAFPDKRLILLEKEPSLARHQTGRNSGVIHSGIYYKPGSYKAKNCIAGRHELVAFAREHNIAHDVCGKIIVATSPSELPHLKRIHQRGIENNIEDLEEIGPNRITEIEPHCRGIAGLRVGCTGIIDFVGVTNKMAEMVTGIQNASTIATATELLSVEQNQEHATLHTNRGIFRASRVIYCGGLQADRLARADGLKLDMAVLGFRGDYFELSHEAIHKVKNLIYPVPNPEFPFLGVHFTRMIDGSVECGPNAVFVFKREGYSKTDFDWRDTREALGFRGTWKFFAKHWRYGVEEYRRAFSKKLFLTQLQRLIPSLTMSDLAQPRAGVRAMALANNGEMLDDFKIEYRDRSVHVLNAPSPAATACLAIGNEVRDQCAAYFSLR